MDKKIKLTLFFIILCGLLTVTGCKKDNTQDEEQIEVVDEMEKEFEGFVYTTSLETGLLIKKYVGEDEAVVIPKEIHGEAVSELGEDIFSDCNNITSVTVPPNMYIPGGIFSKFPDVILKGYRSTSVIRYAWENDLAFEVLDESEVCVSLVQLYDTKNSEVVSLFSGDSGTSGVYSEGASFEVQEGKAILTLDGYHGGMIRSREYGSLTIRLKEGSENTIHFDNAGIEVTGNLTIEGNGSLTIEGTAWAGIYIIGDLSIQGGAKIRVNNSETTESNNWAMLANNGNITITDSFVELSAGAAQEKGTAIFAYSDLKGGYGKITLNDVNVTAGGKVTDAKLAEGGAERIVGQTVSDESVVIVTDLSNGVTESVVSYVKIEPIM